MAADERAAYLLNHLENEIQQLQAKWDFVAELLHVRETQIDELQREAKTKAAAAEDLQKDLAEHAAARQALQTELEQTAERAAELVETRAAQDAELAQREQTLAQERAKTAALEDKLAGLTASIVDLTRAVESGRRDVAEAERRCEDQVSVNNQLRATIQELESYIDSRKSSWATLNQKLGEHQGALAGFRRSIDAKDSQLAEHGKEKQQLAARILGLERSCAEHEDRNKAQEAAYAELQARVSAETSAAAQLRSGLADASAAVAETAGELVRRDELVAALERDLAQRERTIADLSGSLENQRDTEADLRLQNDQLMTRVRDLEVTANERYEQVQRLQTSRAAADQALRDAERQIAKIEHQSEEQARKVREIDDAFNIQEELVGRLERALRAKQRALDLLERNVKRLDELGASVAGLDRKFASASAEILGADSLPTAGVEMAPSAADIGTPVAPCHKMLIAIDKQGQKRYPVRKANIMIGRATENDIRVPHRFISRVHARIFQRDADTMIEDLGSKNGILVNSTLVNQQTVLRAGDVISLGGSLKLRYVELGLTTPSGQAGIASAETPSPAAP
jgi:chromosome segregation ATPase